MPFSGKKSARVLEKVHTFGPVPSTLDKPSRRKQKWTKLRHQHVLTALFISREIRVSVPSARSTAESVPMPLAMVSAAREQTACL